MLHRFQDIRVEFKYPFRDIPQCYNVSSWEGEVATPWRSYQIAGLGPSEGEVEVGESGGGGMCVCVCPLITMWGMGKGVCGLPKNFFPVFLGP